MPKVYLQTTKVRTTRKSKKKEEKLTNGKEEIALTNLKFPTYQQTKKQIDKKAGNRPELPKDLKKGNWSKQALKVLGERYLKKDIAGNTETPEEMCWRVAWEIASAEVAWGKSKRQVINLAKKFYKIMIARHFLPNSPTLMNAGTDNMLQYSGCYVLPVEDSLEGIFDSLKYQALIHQSGGGTGFSFSRLRPSGSYVRSSGGVASGPVSFMKIFDASTNQIKQGGKRRGANMGILRVDHPDILKFIHCKESGGITNFNISVGITDKFMEALTNDNNYELVDPKTKKTVSTLRAKEVFDEIAESAWKTGDPGLVYLDKINNGPSNAIPSLGPIESTNPCGEQPLYSYDACNLGSIFLKYFVKNSVKGPHVDWNGLKSTTRLAVRFLDDVIEVNPYPLTEIRKTVLATRRIGLGVGGWADMLVGLGIAYDSEEALVLADKVMKTIQDEAVKTSQRLAKERGPFPLWPISIYKDKKPRRNSTVTTIAPTGTISIIANASSGIEPLFAIAYQHVVKDEQLDRTLDFINPEFEKVARKNSFWSNSLKKKVLKHGTVREIDSVPENVKTVFGTAHDIDYDWHVKMQSSFQNNIENAVSKTINLKNNATVEDIKESYLASWELGCKGITVFRDGCKDAQVLNVGVGEKDEKEKDALNKVWQRPMCVEGSTYKIKTPVGTAFITVNKDESGNPFEIFINIGRAGSDVQAMAEALGRLISKSLKLEGYMSPKEKAYIIVDQLRGIGGRRSVGFGPNKILSLPDAIAVALSVDLGIRIHDNGNGNGNQYKISETEEGEEKNDDTEASDVGSDKGTVEASGNLRAGTYGEPMLQEEKISVGDICPVCGVGSFVYEEGCAKCYSCGNSEC